MATLRSAEKLSKILHVRKTPLNYFTRSLFQDILRTPLKDLIHKDIYPSTMELLPRPYPKTKKEFEESAARYNLHPYEYKPCSNEYIEYGDYPDQPLISVQARCPYYPWDFPSQRRNFNEFIHRDQDLAGQDRYDYGIRKDYDEFWGPMGFFAAIAVVAILYYISGDTSQPVMEKQYLYKGEHYTFELN